MSPIDYFAWIVLIIIIVVIVWLFVALAMLPGQIARKRGHPQAEAINAAGWLGLLLTLGVVWSLALIWALMKPTGGSDEDDSTAVEMMALKARVEEFETRLDPTGASG